MKYVVFLCGTIKILISNWPRTRKFSHLLQTGKTVAFDFAHHGHALVKLYVQFLCSDWSKFDRWVHAENVCSISNRVYLRYIQLCEFRKKVRQYCINKFVRTTLLRKKIILFENNIYILVKTRENNDSVKYYIYTIEKKLGEERNARSSTLYN